MSQDILNKFEQLFDDYLDGSISSIDKTELEQAFKAYPELKTKLEEHIDARANIRMAGEQNLKNLFLKEFESGTNIEDDTQPLANTSQNIHLRKYGIIALISLACILGVYLFVSKNKTSTPVEPLQIAMVEDPSYELLRGESDTGRADNWRQAVQSFMRKDYKQSITLLEDLKTDSTFLVKHGGKYSLMKGVAFFKLEQFDLAEAALNKVNISNPYFDQVEWYLCLVAYFNNKPSLAKQRLEMISQNTSHYRKDKAIQLLSQLE